MKQNNFKIAVFAGDGVGPEIMKEALKILKLIADNKNINLQLNEGLVGGSAYDHFGVPLPDSTLELALKSDAVLLGAVGGPRLRWADDGPGDHAEADRRLVHVEFQSPR